MKPNFALSLSFDGLRLMHRVSGGWELVGEVALDDADLTASLARLRAAGNTLAPEGMTTKLLLPNEQIKYLALDTTRTDKSDVEAALDGATPYAIGELAYDFAKGGGRTYIAAVAKETLAEAESFATEHDFNPVCFVGVPEPFTYVGEPFFGATSTSTGQAIERDDAAVVVIGTAAVVLPDPVEAEAEATSEPEPEAEAAPETETETAAEPETVEAPEVEEAVETETDSEDADTSDAADAAMESDLPAEVAEEPDEAEQEDATEAAPTTEAESAPEPTETAEDEPAEAEADVEEDTEGEAQADEDDTPVSAPVFSAHAREVAPPSSAPAVAAPTRESRTDESSAPLFGTRRDRSQPQPSSRMDPPPLAVPQAEDATGPTLSGASRDDLTPPPAPQASINAQTPDVPDAVPSITGEAATAVPVENAPLIGATLDPQPEFEEHPIAPPPAADTAEAVVAAEPEQPASAAGSAGKTAVAGAIGAIGAAGGAVGGMFQSRRMARKASAKEQAAQSQPDERSRLTVFGARKQPKPKLVVGGKPKFLGLLLTVILLLFLLAVAAFAALNEDVVARWFGFGQDAPVATAGASDLAADPQATAAPEVAAVTDTIAPTDTAPAADPTGASDALAAEQIAPAGQVLSPAEAQRIYAATGVWQRAPRIPVLPRTQALGEISISSGFGAAARIQPGGLPSSSDVAGDSVIAAPINPPAPTTIFNYGADGLVVASETGALTPDGILVIAGAPSLNPPTRPGTIAPEVTPLEQLASVIPETAAPVEDAPDGVIVIAGRPAIAPPVRPGTVAPVAIPPNAVVADDGLVVVAGRPAFTPPIRPGTATPEAPADPAPVEVSPTAEAPVAADDGLVVIAGAPPLLPPARPGTVAPTAATPAAPAPAAEGLNVIAGSPPILPPARPGTTAPVDAAAAVAPTDATAPLVASIASFQSDLRPSPRPASITALANAPILGTLSRTQAIAFRPRTRPAGLAPAPVAQPEPEPEPEPVVAATPTTPTLEISAEIAAAVQQAANRPDPFATATTLAVPQSRRPDTRPRNMSRIVARANEARTQAVPAAAVAPRTVAPSGPTTGSVAQTATLENAINLREINLIGIYGSSNDRRALVRLANGNYRRVTVGDRLDGGRVQAINDSALIYTSRGRNVTLQVGG